MGVSLDVKGEACGNDFHESMQVNVSQCKSMYDGQDMRNSKVGRAGGLRAQDGGEVVADDYALDQGAWLHPAGVRVAAGFAG